MINYVEVQENTLIQYPYTLSSMMAENPYTTYGPYVDFVTVFPETQTAIENGYSLSPVTLLDKPAFDPSTQICTQDAAPMLVSDQWQLGWTIATMTPDQQAAYDADRQANNKSRAGQLLANTDWVELPSVTDTANTPHLLNADDFLTYRLSLRAIAVNPTITVVWPTIPPENWG